jgi:predicted permease
VEAVSLAESPPLNPFNRQTSIKPEGYEPPGSAGLPAVEYNVVTPDYFRTLGISLVSGRAFAETDDADAPPAVVVNQALAEKYWPGQEPVGHRIGTKGKQWQVVGVVRTTKYTSLAEAPRPYLYLPLYQFYEPATVVHVRTSGSPSTMVQTLRNQVRDMDPTLPVSGSRPLVEQLSVALLPARMGALVLAAFGLLALLLAAVGLYGTLAYSVSQRSREIGIRMALGADGRKLLWLVMGQGVKLAAIGVVMGLAIAFAASGLVSSLLYGVSPLDPVTFLAVSAFLVAVAVLASLIPAQRAIRVDPVSALRSS